MNIFSLVETKWTELNSVLSGSSSFTNMSLPVLTSPEHVLPLQKLYDGGLSGRNQDDAAIFSPAYQATLGGDVDAGCHLWETCTESGT